MSRSDLACIVLAAGQSKRMKSKRSKALHALCGVPLLARVLRTVHELQAAPIVTVVPPDEQEVTQLAQERGSQTCVQEEPRGTGHATFQAASVLGDFEGTILLTCVDIPLLRVETLRALIAHHQSTNAAATILTAEYADPSGYGRIVRDTNGSVKAIIEHRDADEVTLAIREINSSVYCFRSPLLFELVARLRTENAQGEQYLTDVIGMMVALGERVEALRVDDPQEIAGINNRIQLAEAERVLRDRTRKRLMLEGVTLIDPASIYIDDTVAMGPDTTIYPCTFILGDTRIGSDCQIGPHATIQDCEVGDGVVIRHGSFVTGSQVGDAATIGPFAHIRAGCDIGRGARAGSYIEMKAATLGEGVKAGHVSYLGDVSIGAGANIGAGTIVCNYDGARKHKTVIGKGAFIGSNVSLVAPVIVGDGAYIGAGSVITKDVPPHTLAVGRAKQRIIEGWKPPRGNE
ncbi:MAG: bifunctional UDP-N-acetylglucosamine diphosphorylase/glucosamine-1-phosphate N-acetyltransferase GlmU [Candidatus Zipacnadales bacterium]